MREIVKRLARCSMCLGAGYLYGRVRCPKCDGKGTLGLEIPKRSEYVTQPL